jgi:protein TonB
MVNQGVAWGASLLAAAALHAAIVAGGGLLLPAARGAGTARPAAPIAVEVAVEQPAPAASAPAPARAPEPPAPAASAVAAEAAPPAATGPEEASAAPAVAAPAPSAGGAAAEPAAVRQAVVLTRPRPLRDPAPVYPAVARRRGEQGTVRCLVRIDAAGRVERATVIASSGSPALDRAAVEAVERAAYAPARAGERAVSGELTVAVRFVLQ